MRQKMKQLMGILLTLVMVLGLMPGLSLTAYADDPYASIKNTTTVIKFDNKEWYLIDYDASTVTLLAKECVASSQYNSSGKFVEYSNNPTVKTAVDKWYNNNITADAKKAVSGDAMFLLTKGQAKTINPEVLKCNQASEAFFNAWWLCSQGFNAYIAAYVLGGSGDIDVSGTDVVYTLGVRPALKLNLSSVIFSSKTNTFSLKPAGYSVTLSGGVNATTSGGPTTQTGLTGAMTPVTYTANTGYYFKEFAEISSNGITARRKSSTVVTVSGTPKADATITVPIAEAKSSYSYVSGAQGIWQKESGGNLSFRIKSSGNDGETFNKFTGIQVEGKPVDKNKYEAKAGSVIINLKPTYLETLSVGEHKLKVVFDDGNAETSFTIIRAGRSAGNLPQTGDAQNPLLYTLIALISMAGIGLFRKKMK